MKLPELNRLDVIRVNFGLFRENEGFLTLDIKSLDKIWDAQRVIVNSTWGLRNISSRKRTKSEVNTTQLCNTDLIGKGMFSK